MSFDSAGVAVVVNAAPQWSPDQAWSIEEPAVLEIGIPHGSGELQFHNISGAVHLADGRVAVANAGTGELRYFSPSGEYIGSFGRIGGGPGEFQVLSGVYLMADDSILALDSRAARISVIGPSATFSRSATFEPRSTGGPGEGIGVLVDGSIVVRSPHGRTGTLQTGMVVDSVVYLRYSRTGVLIDTIARGRGEERYLRVQGSNVSVTTPLFGKFPVAAAAGDQIFLAYNDGHEVHVYGADGTLRKRIQFSREARPVRSAHVDAFVESVLESASGDGAREHLKRTLSEMPVPTTLPTLARLLVDSDRNLWMLGYAAPGEDPAPWSIVDPAGKLLGSVTVPTGFRPTSVGSDEILGVYKDELGVEYVRSYTIRKPAP